MWVFQILVGRLRTTWATIAPQLLKQFQILVGRLRTILRTDALDFRVKFQILVGRLRTVVYLLIGEACCLVSNPRR
jgi:hypothetical protein